MFNSVANRVRSPFSQRVINRQAFARKVIRPFGSLTKSEIENEMKAIDELSHDGGHPNIITVLCHDWRGPPFSFYFIDMELCELSLHHYIHGDRSLDQPRSATPLFVSRDSPFPTIALNVWMIMSHITRGVEFIHSRKQVHRDLKPRNSTSSICYTNSVLYSSSTNLWKIADFGCTVEGTSSRPRSTSLARGTASYRAPELLTETAMYTNKLDIWAVGCILYELATGQAAFTGDWEVRNFVVNRTELQIPLSLPQQFRVKIATAVDALLRRDWHERPKASDIRAKFDVYCQEAKSSVPVEQEESTTLDPFEISQADSEAISDWKTLIHKNPENLALYKRLADAYKREGKVDMEIGVLQKAATKDPSSRCYRDQLTDAYDRRDTANLRLLGWKDLLEPHGDDWVLVDNRDDNVQYWKERVYQKPGDLNLQLSLVRAFREQGNIDEEIATFNDLIRRFPGAWYLADRLADAYKKKGDTAEAIVSWKELVEMQPDNTWWQTRLSEAYKLHRNIDDEIAVWRRLVSRNPEIESLQDHLADAYDRKSKISS